MNGKNYEMDMTQGPLLGKIMKFSLPIMLSGILQMFYNAADMIVAGKFAGAQALAAVGSTGSLVNLVLCLFIGMALGVSVCVANHYGAKEYEQVSRATHTSIVIGFIGGIAVGIFGVVMSRTFLEWMGSPEDVIDQATLYLRIYFIGMPALVTYNNGASVLRAVGNTRTPMFCLIISGAVNVVLNLVFVIVFHLDVAGVAIATVISQVVATVLVLIALTKNTGACHLEISKLCIDMKLMLEMLKTGIPAGLQTAVYSISNVLIQSSINSFGSMAMAGNSASANLENFIYVCLNSISQATLSFTAQNVGAKRYDRIGKVVWNCNLLVLIFGVVMAAVMLPLSDKLIGFYNSDPDVIAYGVVRFRIMAVTYFLCGFIETFPGSMRGMGHSVTPTIVSAVGACGIRILWLATVFQIWHTTEVVYYSYPVSWIITTVAQFICYAYIRRKHFPSEAGIVGAVHDTAEQA